MFAAGPVAVAAVAVAVAVAVAIAVAGSLQGNVKVATRKHTFKNVPGNE
jgi:hypothetical protein